MVDAGIVGMMRRTGYLRFYRSAQVLAAEIAKDEAWRKTYGIKFEVVDAGKLAELEPHLKGPRVGGVWMPEPVSVADPGGVTKAYARLFTERGGRFLQGDARTLSPLAERLAGAHERRAGRRPAPWWWRWARGPTTCCGRWAIAFRSASSAAITCISRRPATPRSTAPSSTCSTAMRSRRW